MKRLKLIDLHLLQKYKLRKSDGDKYTGIRD